MNIYKSTQNRGLFLLFATHRKTLLHLKPNNWIQKYHFVLKEKKKKKVLFCFIFPSPVTTYSHSYNHASDKTSIAFRTWDCTIYVTEVAKDFIQFCNRPFLSILKVNPDHNWKWTCYIEELIWIWVSTFVSTVLRVLHIIVK